MQLKKSILLLIITILFSCSEDITSPQDKEKPVVSILYPANNSEFQEHTIITIQADASDNESVKEVEFYIDDELEFNDNTEPYQYEWDTSNKAGSHAIKAKAYDASNNIGDSEIVSTKIIAVTTNTMPTASFIFSPAMGITSTTFQFDASGSSDYEDTFSQLRFSWDWENDGTWDINNSTNYNPSHQYSSIGNYSVRLKVIDSGNLFDDTTKTVGVFVKGTATDIDGNVYITVKIGNQWWMAENLKVTHYNNGDVIPNVNDFTEWGNLTTTGAYCNYSIATYGKLYNWYAVNDNRNIAPSGWHVPTDAEWKELEIYLGMSQSEADTIRWRGTDEGGKLKETGTDHWEAPNTGATNECYFSALPGGKRYIYGEWDILGRNAYFWSSTENDSSKAWARYLNHNRSKVFRNSDDKRVGYSVRCIRD